MAHEFDAFQTARHQLTMTYHEEGLQITAAEKKASLNVAIQQQGRISRRLKDRVESFERAEENLRGELEVRLELVRTGTLTEADAVPKNIIAARMAAGSVTGGRTLHS